MLNFDSRRGDRRVGPDATSPVGRYIGLYYVHDSTADSDDMGRSRSRWNVRCVRECLSRICNSLVWIRDAERRQEHLLTLEASRLSPVAVRSELEPFRLLTQNGFRFFSTLFPLLFPQ